MREVAQVTTKRAASTQGGKAYFTTLYWDFLDRHRGRFERNHRMAQPVRGLDRLADLDEVRNRAQVVLRRLSEGRL